MTTDQGIPVADNQNSCDRGLGAHAAGRLHPPREDHPLRSRTHSRAHRACTWQRSTWLLRVDPVTGRPYPRAHPDRGRGEDTRIHPFLDRGRWRRLGGYPARRARLRGQVLYQGGQLGPGRQQHSGVLHPGRHEIPGPGARSEDGTGPCLPAGRLGPRHLLGLHFADARVDAHDHVGNERPCHSALAAHDRRLRRAQFPPAERGRRVDLRQIPLAAKAGHPVNGLGRSAEAAVSRQ